MNCDIIFCRRRAYQEDKTSIKERKGPMIEPDCSPFVERITKLAEELSSHEKMAVSYVFYQLENVDSK